MEFSSYIMDSLKILRKSVFLEIRCVFTSLLQNNPELFVGMTHFVLTFAEWDHLLSPRQTLTQPRQRPDYTHVVLSMNKVIPNLYFKSGWVICNWFIIIYIKFVSFKKKRKRRCNFKFHELSNKQQREKYHSLLEFSGYCDINTFRYVPLNT